MERHAFLDSALLVCLTRRCQVVVALPTGLVAPEPGAQGSGSSNALAMTSSRLVRQATTREVVRLASKATCHRTAPMLRTIPMQVIPLARRSSALTTHLSAQCGDGAI